MLYPLAGVLRDYKNPRGPVINALEVVDFNSKESLKKSRISINLNTNRGFNFDVETGVGVDRMTVPCFCHFDVGANDETTEQDNPEEGKRQILPFGRVGTCSEDTQWVLCLDEKRDLFMTHAPDALGVVGAAEHEIGYADNCRDDLLRPLVPSRSYDLGPVGPILRREKVSNIKPG